MAEPLILWEETFRFLQLLGRSTEDPLSVHGLLFPPKEKKKDSAFAFFPLTEAGRALAEKRLHGENNGFSYGIRINPGGTKKVQISRGVALFFECDAGLSLEDQEKIPRMLGLPAPTLSTWSGHRSLHHYWAAEAGQELPPKEWEESQKRLIAAVQEMAPSAGVDESICFPNAAMRVPGGVHPATGERCRIHSESGNRYDLAALVEMLPLPVIPMGPTPVMRMWENRTEEAQQLADLSKATDAIKYLPPEHFTGYRRWLQVGMALHSVSTGLFNVWLIWSEGMGEAFDAEECQAKWESFSNERDSSISLGSLIHWAKEYGYRPPAGEAPPPHYTSSPASPALSASPASPNSNTVGGVRGLTIHARMDLLREAAIGLLTEEAALLDRLPAMREKASELDLPVRDGDLNKIIWEARRKLSAPVAALGEGDLLDFTPVPWCWEGLIMREATTLVIAAPKVGKTSLLLEALGSWSRGEAFLGRPFHGPCPPVLIVGTDQPQSDWGRMLQKVGLVSQERRILAPLVGLFHSGTPLQLDPEGIEKISAYAKKHPGLLVLVDSYSRCISSLGLSERDAEVVGPLADLQEAVAPYGATLVVIHHSNKGAHDSGSMASRGSTALPAAVSQILHLQRLEAPQEQQGASAGKRMLTTEGRGGAPEKFLIELDAEGRWIFKGDGDALLREQERQRTISSLNERQSLALEHLEETWEQTEGRQGLSAELLASLMDLKGADTVRTARSILRQLQEKGLARKAVQSEGKGTGLVARYIPLEAQEVPEAHSPQTPPTQFPLGEEGKEGEECLDSEWKITLARPVPFCYSPGDPVEISNEAVAHKTGWQVVAASGVVARILRDETGEVREVPQSDLIFMPF